MRDIELMEFSLLKTLNGFLMPIGLKILKIDAKERPYAEIVFNNAQCIVNIENRKPMGKPMGSETYGVTETYGVRLDFLLLSDIIAVWHVNLAFIFLALSSM